MRFHDLGRLDEARDDLTQALQLDPELAQALELLAAMERENGNLQRSVDLLQGVVKLQPENANAHYDLGQALAGLSRRDEAVPHWERAIAIQPNHKEALYKLAQALRKTDPERARKYQRRFQQLGAGQQVTDRAGALWNFALAAAEKKDWPRAISLFEQAVEVCGDCPTKGQIHKNFGLIYRSVRRLLQGRTRVARSRQAAPR